MPFAKTALRHLVLAASLATAVIAAPVIAQQTLVIGNDRGGLVGQRAQLIERLKRAGQRVEIRGSVCYSSCTMYLGAGNVCVDPRTSFGFHGPSRSGRPLPADQFDKWSRIMAQYYSPQLQQWFMTQARYSITTVTQISGRELIAMGYRTC